MDRLPGRCYTPVDLSDTSGSPMRGPLGDIADAAFDKIPTPLLVGAALGFVAADAVVDSVREEGVRSSLRKALDGGAIFIGNFPDSVHNFPKQVRRRFGVWSHGDR